MTINPQDQIEDLGNQDGRPEPTLAVDFSSGDAVFTSDEGSTSADEVALSSYLKLSDLAWSFEATDSPAESVTGDSTEHASTAFDHQRIRQLSELLEQTRRSPFSLAGTGTAAEESWKPTYLLPFRVDGLQDHGTRNHTADLFLPTRLTDGQLGASFENDINDRWKQNLVYTDLKPVRLQARRLDIEAEKIVPEQPGADLAWSQEIDEIDQAYLLGEEHPVKQVAKTKGTPVEPKPRLSTGTGFEAYSAGDEILEEPGDSLVRPVIETDQRQAVILETVERESENGEEIVETPMRVLANAIESDAANAVMEERRLARPEIGETAVLQDSVVETGHHGGHQGVIDETDQDYLLNDHDENPAVINPPVPGLRLTEMRPASELDEVLAVDESRARTLEFVPVSQTGLQITAPEAVSTVKPAIKAKITGQQPPDKLVTTLEHHLDDQVDVIDHDYLHGIETGASQGTRIKPVIAESVSLGSEPIESPGNWQTAIENDRPRVAHAVETYPTFPVTEENVFPSDPVVNDLNAAISSGQGVDVVDQDYLNGLNSGSNGELRRDRQHVAASGDDAIQTSRIVPLGPVNVNEIASVERQDTELDPIIGAAATGRVEEAWKATVKPGETTALPAGSKRMDLTELEDPVISGGSYRSIAGTTAEEAAILGKRKLVEAAPNHLEIEDASTHTRSFEAEVVSTDGLIAGPVEDNIVTGAGTSARHAVMDLEPAVDQGVDSLDADYLDGVVDVAGSEPVLGNIAGRSEGSISRPKLVTALEEGRFDNVHPGSASEDTWSSADPQFASRPAGIREIVPDQFTLPSGQSVVHKGSRLVSEKTWKPSPNIKRMVETGSSTDGEIVADRQPILDQEVEFDRVHGSTGSIEGAETAIATGQQSTINRMTEFERTFSAQEESRLTTMIGRPEHRLDELRENNMISQPVFGPEQESDLIATTRPGDFDGEIVEEISGLPNNQLVGSTGGGGYEDYASYYRTPETTEKAVLAKGNAQTLRGLPLENQEEIAGTGFDEVGPIGPINRIDVADQEGFKSRPAHGSSFEIADGATRSKSIDAGLTGTLKASTEQQVADGRFDINESVASLEGQASRFVPDPGSSEARGLFSEQNGGASWTGEGVRTAANGAEAIAAEKPGTSIFGGPKGDYIASAKEAGSNILQGAEAESFNEGRFADRDNQFVASNGRFDSDTLGAAETVVDGFNGNESVVASRELFAERTEGSRGQLGLEEVPGTLAASAVNDAGSTNYFDMQNAGLRPDSTFQVADSDTRLSPGILQGDTPLYGGNDVATPVGYQVADATGAARPGWSPTVSRPSGLARSSVQDVGRANVTGLTDTTGLIARSPLPTGRNGVFTSNVTSVRALDAIRSFEPGTRPLSSQAAALINGGRNGLRSTTSPLRITTGTDIATTRRALPTLQGSITAGRRLFDPLASIANPQTIADAGAAARMTATFKPGRMTIADAGRAVTDTASEATFTAESNRIRTVRSDGLSIKPGRLVDAKGQIIADGTGLTAKPFRVVDARGQVVTDGTGLTAKPGRVADVLGTKIPGMADIKTAVADTINSSIKTTRADATTRVEVDPVTGARRIVKPTQMIDPTTGRLVVIDGRQPGRPQGRILGEARPGDVRISGNRVQGPDGKPVILDGRITTALADGRGLVGMSTIRGMDGRLVPVRGDLIPVRGENRYITGLELALVLSLAGIAKVRPGRSFRIDGRIYSVIRQGDKVMIQVDGRGKPMRIGRLIQNGRGKTFQAVMDEGAIRRVKLSTLSMSGGNRFESSIRAQSSRYWPNMRPVDTGRLATGTRLFWSNTRYGVGNFYSQRRGFAASAQGQPFGNGRNGAEQSVGLGAAASMIGYQSRVSELRNILTLPLSTSYLDVASDGRKSPLEDEELINELLTGKPFGPLDEELEEENVDEILEDEDPALAGLTPTLRRRVWNIAPGETLQGIADKVFADEDVCWLIADLNAAVIRQTVMDGKRVVEVRSRQQLALPVQEEVEEFYRSRRKGHRAGNLVTIVVERQIDKEVVDNALSRVLGGASGASGASSTAGGLPDVALEMIEKRASESGDSEPVQRSLSLNLSRIFGFTTR